MEGIRILEEIMVKGAPFWAIILTLILIIFGFIIMSISDGEPPALEIGVIMFIIGLCFSIYCTWASCNRPTGEIRYKILVDDVNKVNFSQYEIYEQEGDVITIEEKE